MTTQRYLVDEITKAAPREAIAALGVACRAITGEIPTAEGLACLVAQSALETGHWKYCHRWNFGNVKASSTYGGAVTYFGCNEVLGGNVCWFHPTEQWDWPGHDAWIARHPFSRPNDSQCRWRAYETIELGACAQLSFLAKVSRYAKAWAIALSGDPAAFSHALKAAGYYTANEATYTRTLQSLFGKYLLLCREVVTGMTEPVEPEPLPEPDEPNPTHDPAPALSDEWLGSLELELPWDDMKAERDAAVAGEDE